MSDYFELDFHRIDSDKSADCITGRLCKNNQETIYVIDGGYQSHGPELVERINKYYNYPSHIDHVVATHNDGDHTGGLRSLFENFKIGTLWLLKPSDYAEELLPRFSRYTSVEGLRAKLKEAYSNLEALEELAIENDVQVKQPFQGVNIGEFLTLAPSKNRFLDCIVASDKTPDSSKSERQLLIEKLAKTLNKVKKMLKSVWGNEPFSLEETSMENEMSVVNFLDFLGRRVLLTADVGRRGLSEAYDFASACGVSLPGLDLFQVPHHGSRRNVSTELLDKWLGERISSKEEADEKKNFKLI